jgi:hypothetical protein
VRRHVEPGDSLLTIAEMALGLAGFTAVVAAFTRPEGLAPADRWRFVVLFGIAIQVLLLSFVPIALASAGLSDLATWRTSSLVFAGVWTATGLLILRTLRGRRRMDPEPTLVGSLPVFIPAGFNFLLQTCNAVGWPTPPSFVSYLLGLLILLYIGAVFFAYLVLYRPKP